MKRLQRNSLAKVLSFGQNGLLLILLVTVALWHTAPAAAQSGDGYDLFWWTVDGGGYTFSTGGDYSLGGTVGQPDAAVWGGDGYILAGGFWGGAVVEYHIYLPLVLRNY